MTYRIVTSNNNNLTVYGIFQFPTKYPSRILSFLYYIKSSKNFENFFIIEDETGDSYKLSIVFDKICRKIRMAENEK